MKNNFWILALMLLPVIAPRADAEIITFEHRSLDPWTGSIGNIQFNARFVITAVADTDDRVQDGNVWFIDHDSGSIEIEGVGTFDFISPTRTFVNNGRESVGFSRAGINGSDLFNGPSHPDFVDWDMSTSIGPISGSDGRLRDWGREPVETTGGILFFDLEEDMRVTFTATVIPAPCTLAFFCLAVFASKRRRRLK